VNWWNPTGIGIIFLFPITDDDDDDNNDNIQVGFISTYCIVYTMHKLLQHVSTNIFKKNAQKLCWVKIYNIVEEVKCTF